MAVIWGTTDQVHTNGIKVCVYGYSGSGKTRIMATAPAPFIVCTEQGLMSLKHVRIPYAHIQNLEELREVHTYLLRNPQFKTIGLDTISDFAEMTLALELKAQKDPRKAYLETQRQMAEVIREFREMSGRNVIFGAKCTTLEDPTTGQFKGMPAMPGKTMTEALPHYFDQVWRAYTVKAPTAEDPNGVAHVLQCHDNGTFLAKDRGPCLGPVEWPNLENLFARIAQPLSAVG